MSLLAAAAIAIVASLAGTYIPVRRAAAIDPVLALRSEIARARARGRRTRASGIAKPPDPDLVSSVVAWWKRPTPDA